MIPAISYRDPIDHGPLVEEADCFRNPRNGASYPIAGHIPVFLPANAVAGPNLRYQRLYDRISRVYDLGERAYAWLNSGKESARRKTYLDLLELRPGAAVLEVSVGTGANWQYLGRDLDFYGHDLSAGMLARCRRRAERLRLNYHLSQGLAECLPFPESCFDCVYHVGGINFFSDPGAALSEMARVAKPGTRLLVVDETEEVAMRLENKMIARAFFKNRPRTIVAPAVLLPAGMREVEVREIFDRQLYVLSFRKS